MRILMAIDGSKHSSVTVRMGVQLIRQSGGYATVMTVVRPRASTKRAETALERATELIRQVDPEVETLVCKGNPVDQITSVATKGKFDLVLLGLGPFHRRLKSLFGPFAERILARVPCPVIIVKQEAGTLERILFCDSGAHGPSLLRRFTSQLAGLINRDTQVTVLHVMSQMSAGPGVPGWQLRAEAEELIKARSPEGYLLEQDIQELKRYQIHPKVAVRHGWVVDEILAEAQSGDYGLIVIGAHRTEGWQRLLLDDLAHQIILKADRPVLVL